MKRRTFLGMVLASRVLTKLELPATIMSAQFEPVKLDTDGRIHGQPLGARTEYRDGEWRVYDKDGILRLRMGVF